MTIERVIDRFIGYLGHEVPVEEDEVANSPWTQEQLFSSKSVEWGTPQALFDALNQEFGFGLDAAASDTNHKVPHYYTKDDDALTKEWAEELPSIRDSSAIWMNPPWGRGIGKWIEKAYNEAQKGLTVVCLLPSCTDTKWWRDYVWKAAQIRFVTGRLSFVRDDGHTGPCTKGAAIIVFTHWSKGPPSCSLMERV